MVFYNDEVVRIEAAERRSRLRHEAAQHRNRTTPTIVFFHAPLRGTQAKFRHYIDRPSAIPESGDGGIVVSARRQGDNEVRRIGRALHHVHRKASAATAAATHEIAGVRRKRSARRHG